MGSTASLAAGLLLTWITTLFLPANEEQFVPEQLLLLKAVAVFTLFTLAAAGAFYGELRGRKWRYRAFLATLIMFGITVWIYWPVN